jgi:hypothetical protein
MHVKARSVAAIYIFDCFQPLLQVHWVRVISPRRYIHTYLLVSPETYHYH